MQLDILGYGAVTPVGLTAAQTCAAIRAKAARFEPVLWPLPTEEPYLGARVPAALGLRLSRREWLMNLAGRALRECCARSQPTPADTPLLLLAPDDSGSADLLADFQAHVGQRHHPSSRLIHGGAAALAEALASARALLEQGQARHCIVGAVDSLVARAQVERFQRAGRLYRGDNCQGMMPAEGSAFVLLASASRAAPALARIVGAGLGREPNPVDGDEYSLGLGFRAAQEAALAEVDSPESDVDFVCTTMNGERYAASEMMYAHARCYRTRRENLPTLLPATSTGELGVAAGVLALIVAGSAMHHGHHPGSLAACEISSDTELRGVVLLRRAAMAPSWYARLGT